MKLPLFLFAVAALLAPFSRGQEITVEPAEGWEPATAEQLAALKNETNAKVIDFSIYPGDGAAHALYSDAHGIVGQPFAIGTVTGYIKGIAKSGQVFVSQDRTKVGPLSGYRVISHKAGKSGPMQMVSYLVYTRSGVYIFAIFSAEKEKATPSLADRYLARLKFSPSVIPADIDHDAAYELGQKIGRSILKVGAIGGGIATLIIALIIVLKRRRDATPPPLPQ